MKIKLSRKDTRNFISGLYDAEGHFEIDRRKGKNYRIRIKMMNKPIMQQVYDFLVQNHYGPRKFEKTSFQIFS